MGTTSKIIPKVNSFVKPKIYPIGRKGNVMEDNNKPQPGAFLIYGWSGPEEKNQLTPEQMEGLKLLHYALNKEWNVRLIAVAVLIGIPLIALIVCCIMSLC